MKRQAVVEQISAEADEWRSRERLRYNLPRLCETGGFVTGSKASMLIRTSGTDVRINTLQETSAAT